MANTLGTATWNAVAVCVPFTGVPILALPLAARLRLPGKSNPCSRSFIAYLAKSAAVA